MPGLDGWETARRIRELTDVPIIFLTARGEESDRLQGFRLGADDYVPKPFSFPELAARIEAVLRRVQASSPEQEEDVLRCGPFRLDRRRRLLTRNGEPIDLTPTEYRLMEIFLEQPGRVFSQRELVIAVWGPEYAEETGYIRRYVWHLRQKIEPGPEHPRFLLTERGFGYRFEA